MRDLDRIYMYVTYIFYVVDFGLSSICTPKHNIIIDANIINIPSNNKNDDHLLGGVLL